MTRHLTQSDTYQITTDRRHQRIRRVELEPTAAQRFFDCAQNVSLEWMEATPYERFFMAKHLQTCFGVKFGETLIETLKDWDSGAFTLSIASFTDKPEDWLRFVTGMVYLLGAPRLNVSSGKHYTRFAIEGMTKPDSLLLSPYESVYLHTDGAFHAGRSDWLLLAKLREEAAIGGETTLLHLADWEDGKLLSQQPMAKQSLIFRGPSAADPRRATLGNHGDMGEVRHPLFYQENGHPCFRFTYQYIHPESIEQAEFLKGIADSLIHCSQTGLLPLQVGEIYAINNTFWMHGRKCFTPSASLYREIVRTNGVFRQ